LKKNLLALKVKIPECNILSPHSTTNSPDSCKVVNKFLQRNINTKHGCEKALAIGTTTIRPHDPVIVTENNYDLGLFNGTTGTLTDIVMQDDDLIYVFLFDGASKKQFLSLDDVLSLSIKLAYAISIHKSQGSEYEVVVIACIVDTDMIERSLIYTALTRAKKLCIFVGNRQVFAQAVLKPNKADTLETGFIGIEPRELFDT
jgi:exodeoxyribonuclease V alpha subunit